MNQTAYEETNQLFYKGGYKYQATQDFRIQIPIKPTTAIRTDWIELDTAGHLLLKKGYACDGPTDPAKDTKGNMRAAFVHDGVYQLIRLGLLPPEVRPLADEIYYEIMLADSKLVVRRDYHPWIQPIMLKVVEIRSRGHYEVLLGFGSKAADSSSERPAFRAP